ncbi:MAG TPA: hypothetical protein VMF50_07225 [Candidatus Binataceae bacterium]|nr:hypothetical protein [Candidatus Binataceae bacterium]
MTKGVALLLSRWNGGLARPLIGDYVSMPRHLELRGARLLYSGNQWFKHIDASRLLDRFIGLSDQFSSDRDILAFARQYGPLYLCEHHGLAIYHKPLLMNRSPLGPSPIFGIDEPFKYRWCKAKLECRNPEMFSEPLETWRVLAARAANLLLVANTIRLQGDAPPELWEKVDGFGERCGSAWAFLDNPWNRLAAGLDYWMVAAEVGIRIGAEGQSVVASLASNPFASSVFALIAVQLLLAITRSEGLAALLGMRSAIHIQPAAAGRQARRKMACQTQLLPQLPGSPNPAAGRRA